MVAEQSSRSVSGRAAFLLRRFRATPTGKRGERGGGEKGEGGERREWREGREGRGHVEENERKYKRGDWGVIGTRSCVGEIIMERKSKGGYGRD